MTVGSIDLKRRSNPPVWVGRPVLALWTPTLKLEPAYLVQLRPLRPGIGYRLALPRDHVSDPKLMFGMRGWAYSHAYHVLWVLPLPDNESVALILV